MKTFVLSTTKYIIIIIILSKIKDAKLFVKKILEVIFIAPAYTTELYQ